MAFRLISDKIAYDVDDIRLSELLLRTQPPNGLEQAYASRASFVFIESRKMRLPQFVANSKTEDEGEREASN
jgi:hypothetical protein